MTTAFDLRVMAIALQQGARLHALSLGSLALAAAWLIAMVVAGNKSATIGIVVLGSAFAGASQTVFAVRVAFDSALLHALADTVAPPGNAASAPTLETAATMLDRALLSTGVLSPAKAGRDWPARWSGAVRLLRMQALCLGAQLVALCGAFVWSLSR